MSLKVAKVVTITLMLSSILLWIGWDLAIARRKSV